MERLNFKKIFGGFENFFARTGADPYVDWAFILMLSFAVAVVFIGFGAKLFFRVSGEASASGNGSGVSAEVSSVSSAGPSLDTADLDNLISIFQSKNAQLPVFAAAYPGPSDPAIPLAAAKAPKIAASSTSLTANKTPAK